MLRDLFKTGFLRRLESLRIEVKKVALATRKGGYESINKKGSSIEFIEYQAYNPGDDFRYIDWNLYGRLDKLLVKTFKEELELSVHILVDATRSMLFPELDRKFDFSKNIALALAYIGLSNQNSVRVVALNDPTTEGVKGLLLQTPFFQKLSGIFHIKEFLSGLKPGGEVDMVGFLSRYTYENRGRGGTVIIISDLMVPPGSYRKGLNVLKFKNYDVKVVQVLGPRELDPFKDITSGEIVDVETDEKKTINVTSTLKKRYYQSLEEHNSELRHYCRSNRIAYTLARTDMDFEDLILREMPRIGFVKG